MDLLYNEIIIYGWPFFFTAAPILLYMREIGKEKNIVRERERERER